MIDYSKAVLHEDGTLHNFMLKVAGKPFHCTLKGCGCKCFHKPDSEKLNEYKCNSCGTVYSSE